MSRPTGRDFFLSQGNMVQSGSFYQNKQKNAQAYDQLYTK